MRILKSDRISKVRPMIRRGAGQKNETNADFSLIGNIHKAQMWCISLFSNRWSGVEPEICTECQVPDGRGSTSRDFGNGEGKN